MMGKTFIKQQKFSEIDINDSFFDSLKEDYPGFKDWYNKKALCKEHAYVSYNENEKLDGFLYLKNEYEECKDIIPNLPLDRRLKVGTFKIDAHGTTLGEHFMKIILQLFYESDNNQVYLTIFPRHNNLIELFERFGFIKTGEKLTNGEVENVYLRTKCKINLDIYLDYPMININGVNKYLLGIYPKYHTEMFPYSKLNTEREHKIKDVSHTNSIEKIYLTKMNKVKNFKKNDLILIYRTAEKYKKAEYNSVATSICTVVETKSIHEFKSFEDFNKYIGGNSIFEKEELHRFWEEKKYPNIIKMLYNIPLSKRIIRKKLIEDVGISREKYFGCLELSDKEFCKILKMGEVNESFIIS